jgi:tripartite-type tricarboxylate transporter receptor subunit TctC
MPRLLIRLAAALMLMAVSVPAALAQAWPSKPIRLIVSYPRRWARPSWSRTSPAPPA